MWVYLPYRRLPSEYQEVEYIQSSWTQYIDTGIKFTNSTTSDFDIAFTTNRSWWSWIIGAQYQNVNTSRAIWISTSSFTYQQGSAFWDWTETPTLNQKYNYKNDATNVYVDWVVKKSISSGWSFTTPVNWTIFKVNYSSVSWFPYLVSAKLYKCKLYESWTLIRDFVPCYREQDWVIWLYDLVNDQFYTNAWTGTFSKWSDVTIPVLQNAYIGEYKGWEPWDNTLAYYPLSSDFNDASWNWYNLTNTWATITTKAWVDCAYYNWSSYSTNSSVPNWTSRTLSAWVYIETNKSSNMGVICTWDTDWSFVWLWIYSWKWYITDRWTHDQVWTISVLNWWHLITATISNWSNMILYTDWVQNASYTFSRGAWNSITIGARTWSWTEKLTWYVSNVIVEDKARTADEITAYYNLTKSNYWL